MFFPYQEILLWALGLSLAISVIYRVFTNPEEIRKLKEDMKFYREKSKEAQKNKDMKKANEYMSEMMKLSQKQMKLNMKPMFITMGVVLLILSSMGHTYGGVTVETTPAGDKVGMGYFSYSDFNYSLKTEKTGDGEIKVWIDLNGNGEFSDEEGYAKGDMFRAGGAYWVVHPESINRTWMDLAVKLPFTLPLLGWTYLNWLGWYILITLPATWIFRRMLGVE